MATATNPKGITLYKNENDCYYYINQNGEHIFLGTGITHLDTDMVSRQIIADTAKLYTLSYHKRLMKTLRQAQEIKNTLWIMPQVFMTISSPQRKLNEVR